VPSVSIVIPAFRNVRYINETVESALAQTYADIEVVIGDHSSEDGTWEAIQRYASDPRVRLMRTPTGGGAPANWNAVTAAATGEYVKLLCGDDLIASTCVERQVEALKKNPSAVAVAARRDLIDPAGDVLLSGRGIDPLDGLVAGTDAIRALVRAGTNLLGEPGCVLIRREVLERVGGWLDPYPYLIDQFTYMSVLQHGDLVALPETLASFRVSNTQWSVRLASDQSRQAAGTHRYFHGLLPQTVSRGDVMLGNARARLTALMRRAAYFVWRKRMRGAA
jgi:glycosyltransferase involved in cell wall biosynthesis